MDAKPQFVNAERVHRALTAQAEKRLLLWLAERTPSFINSDHLTLLGFASQLGVGICYAAARRSSVWLWLSVVFLALNWLGDSLDGTLARVRKQQRPRYGFYVDHMADVIGATAMTAGLCASGYVCWQIAISMIIGFLLLSIESFLTAYVSGRFQLSQGVFGPTEIRILLAAGNVALIYHPYAQLLGRRFLLFDVGGLIASVGMAAMLLTTAAARTVELYRAERLS